MSGVRKGGRRDEMKDRNEGVKEERRDEMKE